MGLGELHRRLRPARIDAFVEVDRQQRRIRADRNLALVMRIDLEDVGGDDVLPAVVFEIVAHDRTCCGMRALRPSGSAKPSREHGRCHWIWGRTVWAYRPRWAAILRATTISQVGGWKCPSSPDERSSPARCSRRSSRARRSWPSGPIRIIVPYPAGGSVDAVARLAQAGLQQRLGTTIVVENRSGASGSTGSALVAKSPPDGNTWLLVFDNHAVNPVLLPNYPFDNQKDLEPVTLIGTAPYWSPPIRRSRTRRWRTSIAAAKKAPGKISYGSVGSGSIGHLAMVLLGKQAGIDLTHVPYRGGGPAVNDAVAGHIDLVNGSAALLTPHVAAGRLRPVWQTRRASGLPAHPTVPTVGEGGFPGAEANAWWGAYAPAKTPKEIIDRFRTALVESLREEQAGQDAHREPADEPAADAARRSCASSSWNRRASGARWCAKTASRATDDASHADDPPR